MYLEILALLLVIVAVVVAVVALVSVRALRTRLSRIEDEAPETQRDGERIGVVLNPSKKGAALALDQLNAACANAGRPAPAVYRTTAEDPGYAMARAALADGCTTVIAGGGDGTVRAVAEVMSGREEIMALLPLGTGNLLARNLDIEVDNGDSWLAGALFGTVRKIDAARVRLVRDDGSEETKVFAVIAGIGFDAEMMDATDSELKARLGAVAYAEAGFRKMPGARKAVRIRLDDGEARELKTRSVMIANCGRLQGGVQLAPDARIDDGVLDVVVMSPRSLAGWGWIALKGLVRSRSYDPIVNFAQCRKISLICDEPIAAQLDGDTDGYVRELDVEVLPGALSIRC
ncbi:diacylglycerol/lipid kinase family protein [Zhihengliuella halotolerans]|uniref:Diacylglycerol kinase family enzyme n=1 Tax=Zhihengliuella halotolerans TaxID=370736 RepID=A0A4Q8AH71_9MICC|nr:diacylglycerol kinase family protein [Zhihengliuella halotolerans]RZU63231.1 diacylglycerol kinase family enzyme [Zhihengliuella halotolerans]